jgi:hypothetical protein
MRQARTVFRRFKLMIVLALALGASGVAIVLLTPTLAMLTAAGSSGADVAQADATTGSGSLLSSETFEDPSVSDPRWIGLGDACLTATNEGATAPSGDSDLAGCTKTTDSPDIGSGSGGYLQLTDNSGGSTGAALLDRAFPSSAGLVVTFDEYQYARSGTGLGAADGIGFFMIDGSYTLTQAGPQGNGDGGALGYASIDNGSDQAGIANGYLGVGLDVYGNYSSQPYVGTSCTTSSLAAPNHVALRGPGNGTDGYCLLGTAAYPNLQNAPAAAPDGQQGTLQQVTVEVSPTTPTDTYPTITVSINGATVLTETMTEPAPATLKLGFTASTGGGHEVHLIRDVTVSTVNALGAINLVKTVDHTTATGTHQTIFTEGDSVPYSFLVTNSGTETLSDVTVTDPKIADVSCPSTTLAPADSMTCTGTYGPLTAADAAAGSFTNTATVNGVDTDETAVGDESTATVPTYQSASLSVTKDVTGTGAGLIAGNDAFTVRYSYPAGDYEPASTDASGDPNAYAAGSGTLTVTPDGTATTTRIPAGAEVTFSEDAPSAITDATWGTPTFSENPVAVGDSGTTAVTLDNSIAEELGTLSWSKTDASTGALLAGSVWALTDPDGYRTTVTDNGSGDTDPTAGQLQVGGLTWGNYTLAEKTAPAGYALNTTAYEVMIGPSDLDDSLGAITDVKQAAMTTSASVVKHARVLDSNHDGVRGDPGDTIIYTIVVRNTGTAATVVSLSDPMFEDSQLDCGGAEPGQLALSPGQSRSCVARHTITALDGRRGQVKNVATINYGGDPKSISTVTTATYERPVVKTFEVDRMTLRTSACANLVNASLTGDKFAFGALNWTWVTPLGQQCFSGKWAIVRAKLPASDAARQWIAAINRATRGVRVGQVHTTRRFRSLATGTMTIAWSVGPQSWLVGRTASHLGAHTFFARS